MTKLRREAINDLFNDYNSTTINPGLWLQKGLKETTGENGDNAKTNHLKELVDFTCELYPKAFNRWFDLTSDEHRFSQTVMTLENRLLIGLTGNGALETGCSLSHNYGMPYIPGSSIKGVVRAWAEQHLDGEELKQEIAKFFGTRNSDDVKRGSGFVTFHDAWWIPFDKDKAKPEPKPFVLDVVTTHHQDYYNGKKDKDNNYLPPSDKDSPIPNHLLAVQGSFLFVLEGAPEHVELCQKMLVQALQDNGIGAKTAAGYGYMRVNDKLYHELQQEAEKRLPPEVREKRKQEAIQRQQQAENAKTVDQVCSELNNDYEHNKGSEVYIQKLEERIDYVIQTWSVEDRFSLAKCLNDIGYIPKNKKNKNHEIRKERLKQLRGEK
ncbi:type III-B CRISPR module RAMP protein Cmr6 [Vibrio palustris]|uniref:RAMP superfamily protein n=1 Tax=Vibrio palustris TaxID=1918946 RepID=A0A1R4B2U0_9VIBR|nr:type III-B CRISPR module RAMP protein Cmr6 [Vibrio palustris]SJL83229.1 RAMP superfamily protein [Vibrio palustris]